MQSFLKLETKQSLCNSEEGLQWKEVVARAPLGAADELLDDATINRTMLPLVLLFLLSKVSVWPPWYYQNQASGTHEVARQNQGQTTIVGQQDAQIAGKGYSNERNCSMK